MFETFQQRLDQTHSAYFESAFQADSQLVHFYNQGIIDAIVSNDSDLLAIYGAPFIVKHFKAGKVVIASLFSIASLEGCLTKQPSHKIYSPSDSRLQSIAWSILVGSDLLPGGVPGIGHTTLLTYQRIHSRDVEAILSHHLTELQREAARSAINAGLYEPVFENLQANKMVYIDDAPEYLYETNRHFSLQGYPLRLLPISTVSCCASHQPPAVYALLQCTKCRQSFCQLCARKKQQEAAESFACVDCQFDLSVTEPEGDDPSGSPSRGAADGNDLRSIFSLGFRNPATSLLPEFFEEASQAQLVQFLRTHHVQIDTALARNHTELVELCQSISSGEVRSAYVSAQDDEERAAMRERFPRDLAPWAYPVQLPPSEEPLPLNDSALNQLDFESLISFAYILQNFLPSPETLLTEALGTLHGKLKSLVSPFTCTQALKFRPHGGAERMLKMAIRTLVSPHLRALTACKFKLFRFEETWMLNLTASIPASMQSTRYDASVFLTPEGLRYTACTCPAGSLCCHHCFALLLKLEMASVSPFELLRSIFQILAEKFVTPAVLYEHDALLGRRLMGHFHPNVTDPASWLLPPNDLPQSPPSSTSGPLSHTFYKNILFQSPLCALSDGPKNRALTEATLDDYDPLNGVPCDANQFDWFAIFLSMKRGTVLPDTIGFDVVTLRAELQIRAIRSQRVSDEAVEDQPVGGDPSDSPPPSGPTPVADATEDLASPTEQRKRPRPRRACIFPSCSCTDVSCKRRWTSCPPSRICLNNPAKLEQRKRFLRSLNLLHRDLPVDVRVCGCHEVIDGVPVSKGVDHITVSSSTRASPARQRRLEGLNQPADPSAAQIAHFVEKIDFYETELLRLRGENASLKEQLSAPRVMPRFQFELLATDWVRFRHYTHFTSPADFFGYVDLLCNGKRSTLYQLEPFRYDRIQPDGSYSKKTRDLSEARKKARRKKLQPFDEAFIYFSRCNSVSAEVLANDFGVSVAAITMIVVKWAKFEHCRIKAFGQMLTYDMYEKLCPENWKLLFPDTRVHLWDTTDLALSGKPSDPQLQKLFYSSYYADNVIKVGVGMTPFGWLMAGPAFTGGQSDSTYLADSGIYQRQQQLAERDSGPACLNYTDRGFRDAASAWQAFGQQLITPCNLRNDRFSPIEVLMTTDRANKRARNERAVRLPKALMSEVSLNIPPPLLELIWQNNVFRCNFLYRHLTSSEECAVPRQAREYLTEYANSTPPVHRL